MGGKYEKRIIPIWHNGFNSEVIPKYPAFADVLGKKNAIIVENENVEAYTNAVNKLLNYLGFTPIEGSGEDEVCPALKRQAEH